jgi:sialate O-acetylesterase
MSSMQGPRLLFALLLIAAASCVHAAVAVPHIFSDHMVLQREMPIPVWGWADPGEKVTVVLGDAKVSAEADQNGDWKLKLPAAKAGGPFTMTVTGTNTLTFTDVLIGEVWICSGQSNMEMPINNLNKRDEYIKDGNHPNLRLFLASDQHYTAGMPQRDVNITWQVSVPDTMRRFSAAGYFFGKKVSETLNVPVGMIEAAWGGSQIDPWIPREGFAALPEFEHKVKDIDRANGNYRKAYAAGLARLEAFLPEAKKALAQGRNLQLFPNVHHELEGGPGCMYNALVAPVAPYAIRGALWYQGESNRSDGMKYRAQMEALIAGWRAVWGEGDFPFYFVQLAPYRYDEKNLELPALWEAQVAALKIPNTGMAVINDIGNINDIHPQNKFDVGERLALLALAKTYGQDVVCSGPFYKGMKIEGDKVRVSFENATGLASRDGKDLTWFTIAGADKKFVPAVAKIGGETVVVSADGVTAPVAVRFAWDQTAEPNLTNKAGLSATAFDTETWPLK